MQKQNARLNPFAKVVFNSFQFLWLFPLIFLVYYGAANMPRMNNRTRHRIENIFLVVVSYGLYMQWKPAYAMLLLGVTAVTFAGALTLTGGGVISTDSGDYALYSPPSRSCRS